MSEINFLAVAAFNQAVQAAVAAQLAELTTKITALETKLTEAALFTRTTDVEIQLDKARVIEDLDSQEWFWDKIQAFADKATRLNGEEVAENLSREQLRDIAGRLAENLDYSDLANELDLDDLANHIDLGDLANELETDDIAEKIDVEEAVREFFQNNTFSIRP